MKNKKIQYITYEEDFFECKEYLPQSLKNHTPQWFKNVEPIYQQDNIVKQFSKRILNVKSCPSFIEIYKEGVVLLAPTDIHISTSDIEDKVWSWRTPIRYFTKSDIETITFHTDEQMRAFLPPSSKTKVVFKLNLPYFVQVPKGYNVRVLPVPYQYNNDFTICPGILDAKNQPQVNILFEYTSEKNEILIKQGTPLAVHIPYKVEKFEIDNIFYDKNLHRKLKHGTTLNSKGRFHNSFLRNIKT
tara:strand:+ start:4371 stop:5102 length:732 start_codon:yes stop_codon:yes gene_type:complete